MIAGVGVSNVAELTACLPVELAAVHDDAAQRGAVAADELGGGMDDDICAVLDGADQVRRAEGVVNDQRNAVLVAISAMASMSGMSELGLPSVSR